MHPNKSRIRNGVKETYWQGVSARVADTDCDGGKVTQLSAASEGVVPAAAAAAATFLIICGSESLGLLLATQPGTCFFSPSSNFVSPLVPALNLFMLNRVTVISSIKNCN